ncbi:MAG: hypothetical protein NC408_07865 [Candidatus Gastranaerophilales bacterium]|nr:hypothetical protein [Candidatus Gastranaerophilales bacterium]MCM1072589.1 hypothetical protein [Bacteroides sp.]
MKFVNFTKSLLLFLLFIVFSAIIRYYGLLFFAGFNYITGFDILDDVILYLFALLITFIMCVIIYYLKTKVSNLIFHRFANAILNNKLKVFLYVTGLSILFFTGLILLLFPILYYYIFKAFFKNISFIRKYYLDFKSVKKYFIIIFMLEFPFIFLSICSLFDPELDASIVFGLFAYYMLGNFYFYLQFFVLSWWDNRKLSGTGNKIFSI